MRERIQRLKAQAKLAIMTLAPETEREVLMMAVGAIGIGVLMVAVMALVS